MFPVEKAQSLRGSELGDPAYKYGLTVRLCSPRRYGISLVEIGEERYTACAPKD